jgi:hypothetical protein
MVVSIFEQPPDQLPATYHSRDPLAAASRAAGHAAPSTSAGQQAAPSTSASASSQGDADQATLQRLQREAVYELAAVLGLQNRRAYHRAAACLDLASLTASWQRLRAQLAQLAARHHPDCPACRRCAGPAREGGSPAPPPPRLRKQRQLPADPAAAPAAGGADSVLLPGCCHVVSLAGCSSDASDYAAPGGHGLSAADIACLGGLLSCAPQLAGCAQLTLALPLCTQQAEAAAVAAACSLLGRAVGQHKQLRALCISFCAAPEYMHILAQGGGGLRVVAPLWAHILGALRGAVEVGGRLAPGGVAWGRVWKKAGGERGKPALLGGRPGRMITADCTRRSLPARLLPRLPQVNACLRTLTLEAPPAALEPLQLQLLQASMQQAPAALRCALAACLHARAGAQSPLRLLPLDVLQRILALAVPTRPPRQLDVRLKQPIDAQTSTSSSDESDDSSSDSDASSSSDGEAASEDSLAASSGSSDGGSSDASSSSSDEGQPAPGPAGAWQQLPRDVRAAAAAAGDGAAAAGGADARGSMPGSRAGPSQRASWRGRGRGRGRGRHRA